MKNAILLFFFLPISVFSQYGTTQNLIETDWTRLKLKSTVLGDINGDSFTDLLYSSDNYLVCRFGESGGTFSLEESILSGPHPSFHFGNESLADMDQDGYPELVCSINSSFNFTSIYWFNFNADGFVTSFDEVFTDGGSLYGGMMVDFELSDMDADGDLDILTYYQYQSYEYSDSDYYIDERTTDVVWIEDPSSTATEHYVTSFGSVLSGTFNPYSTNWIYVNVQNLEHTDIDGDGFKDIVYNLHINSGYSDSYGDFFDDSSEIMWSLNDGSNNYEPIDFMLSEKRIMPNYGYTHLTDFNDDGVMDVLHESETGWVVQVYDSIYYANTSPNPNQVVQAAIENFNPQGIHSHLADIDADGDLDLITNYEDAVKFFENLGTEFSLNDSILLSKPDYLTFATVLSSDIENDGDEDIVLSFYGQGELRLLKQSPSEFEEVDIQKPLYYKLERIAYSDIDDDGIEEISAQSENDHLFWLDLDMDGNVLDTNFVSINFTNIKGHYWIDLNADDIDDLLVTNPDGIYYFQNNGDGTFANSQLVNTSDASQFQKLFGEDVDGDGDLDIISSKVPTNGDAVFWLENLGTDLSISHTILNIAGNYSNAHTTLGDFDNNGFQDIVYHRAGQISCLFNDGSGNFSEFLLSQSAIYEHIKVFDYNFDGFNDLLLLDENGDILHFIPNMQNSTFGMEELVLEQINGQNFLVQDIDNDLDFDIISIKNNDTKFYLNTGAYIFNEPVDLNVNTSSALPDVDLNSDGFFDFVWHTSQNIRFKPFEGADIKSISGRVFLDENENGSWDAGEPPFSPASVYFAPDNYTQYITLFGTYTRFYSDLGEHQVSSLDDPDLWNLTTGVPVYDLELTAAEPQIDSVDFGFAPNGVQNIVEGNIYIPNWLCGGPGTIGVSAFNAGNTIPEGYLAFTYDSIISVSSAMDADSIVGHTAFFSYSIDSYYGNQFFEIDVEFPGVDFIDSTLTYTLESFDSFGNLLDTKIIQEVIGCAYDPNDKNENTGYTENGFVLNGSELEYTIRFQNTGTDTAHTVILEDVLDIHLDRNTLYVVDWSHPYELVIDENDKAIFTFPEIFLPDSNVNEPESNGYVKFKISLKDEEYDAGEMIENTCEIYFDFNPAIITNTTLNTIFACDSLAHFSTSEMLCSDGLFEAHALKPWVENYSWQLNGMQIGSDSTITLENLPVGEHWISLTASNPLCIVSDSLLTTVLETPIAMAGADSAFCGSEGFVSASENGFEGYWSGPVEIAFSSPEEFESSISSSGQGSFELIWTSINGTCSSNDTVQITFYEIPWVEIAQVDEMLYANTFGDNFQWYLDGDSIPGANGESYAPTENGVYTVSVEGQNDCVGYSEPYNFILNGINELNDFFVFISPNPMHDFAWIDIETDRNVDFIIEMINPKGKIVRSENFNENPFKIERQNLAAGMYLLMLKTPNGKIVKTEKLLIK